MERQRHCVNLVARRSYSDISKISSRALVLDLTYVIFVRRRVESVVLLNVGCYIEIFSTSTGDVTGKCVAVSRKTDSESECTLRRLTRRWKEELKFSERKSSRASRANSFSTRSMRKSCIYIYIIHIYARTCIQVRETRKEETKFRIWLPRKPPPIREFDSCVDVFSQHFSQFCRSFDDNFKYLKIRAFLAWGFTWHSDVYSHESFHKSPPPHQSPRAFGRGDERCFC